MPAVLKNLRSVRARRVKGRARASRVKGRARASRVKGRRTKLCSRASHLADSILAVLKGVAPSRVKERRFVWTRLLFSHADIMILSKSQKDYIITMCLSEIDSKSHDDDVSVEITKRLYITMCLSKSHDDDVSVGPGPAHVFYRKVNATCGHYMSTYDKGLH